MSVALLDRTTMKGVRVELEAALGHVCGASDLGRASHLHVGSRSKSAEYVAKKMRQDHGASFAGSDGHFIGKVKDPLFACLLVLGDPIRHRIKSVIACDKGGRACIPDERTIGADGLLSPNEWARHESCHTPTHHAPNPNPPAGGRGTAPQSEILAALRHDSMRVGAPPPSLIRSPQALLIFI